MNKVPMMTGRPKKRAVFTQYKMAFSLEQWKRTIFSHEKKLNLDGPDGFPYYWHDVRKKEVVFSNRPNGRDLVMLWSACFFYGLSNLVFCKGNMNSKKYFKLLEKEMLLFAAETSGEYFTFQKDGASLYRSDYTTQWLKDRNVDVLLWPAKSSDLNIIKIFWRLLARRVYANERQCADVGTLSEVVVAVGTS